MQKKKFIICKICYFWTLLRSILFYKSAFFYNNLFFLVNNFLYIFFSIITYSLNFKMQIRFKIIKILIIYQIVPVKTIIFSYFSYKNLFSRHTSKVRQFSLSVCKYQLGTKTSYESTFCILSSYPSNINRLKD